MFKDLDPARAEAVADYAIAIGSFTYKSLASIVTKKLDRSTAVAGEPQAIITHRNLRGSGYFH